MYPSARSLRMWPWSTRVNSPKREATSKPKLIYRDKEQPNYKK